MKILWVKADFLHPTNRGGQIRTLEILKRLRLRHEIHFVGIEDPQQPEGVARSGEYCSYAYPVRHRVPHKASLAFAGQLVRGLYSPLPVAVERYRSRAMRRTVDDLLARHRFDSVVCDFLFPAPNISALESCVLFAHNVEAMIWKRHVEHAAGWPRRLYFRLQARRMFAYERHVCRRVKSVITVSQADADVVCGSYGVERVRPVPTGVDVGYFAPKGCSEPKARLVFLGSMDWLPNIDGIGWFVREVWPRIHRQRPDCSVAIVGRKPTAEVVQLASVPGVEVTGTVADVRPWLWGATVSVVPLRIGGGTRLKIYEAMAARVPVVSTTIGAEGLDARDGVNIRLADTPEDFAARCLELLESQSERDRLACTAWDMVNSRYSWEVVAQDFDRLLL